MIENIRITIEEEKIIITEKDCISEWYNNIHLAIWCYEENGKKNCYISIDGGYFGHSLANKQRIEENEKFLRERPSLFTNRGYSFKKTNSPSAGFLLYSFSFPTDLSNLADLLIKILELINLLIEIYKEQKKR